MRVVFVLVVVLVFGVGASDKWSVLLSGRISEPTCVHIPANLSLCANIGYTKMRLPNLLEHDTLAEVSQQAASWVPLLNVRCDPDTQLFLCSLFSPVCLDRPIYPCRSLCEKVKSSCQGRMITYGFPWPDMVRCDKFPVDNDMCISSLSNTNNNSLVSNETKIIIVDELESCDACKQADTYENILDNYCRADFALRTRIRKRKGAMLYCRKSRVYKQLNISRSLIKKPRLLLPAGRNEGCCKDVIAEGKKGTKYLIMGSIKPTGLIPTFIMPWKRKSKVFQVFRHAIRTFKRLNCSDPRLVTQSMMADAGLVPPSAVTPIRKPPSLRRNRRRERKRKGRKGRRKVSKS